MRVGESCLICRRHPTVAARDSGGAGPVKALISQKIYWAAELPHLALLASMFALAALAWPALPALLPVHWTGLPPAIPMHVDGYGGKVRALLLWPALAAGMYVLFLFASEHFESWPTQGTIELALIRLGMTVMFATTYLGYVLYYKGYGINLDVWERNQILISSSIAVGAFIWRPISSHLRS